MQSSKPPEPENTYKDIRQHVRSCWRKLGMLQLRMTNDLYLGKNRMPASFIKENILQVQKELADILDACDSI